MVAVIFARSALELNPISHFQNDGATIECSTASPEKAEKVEENEMGRDRGRVLI